jgi:hypothetical protein
MGARTNFTFKTDTGLITLYSHWGGDSKKHDLANALEKANGRLQMGDMGYALRIIISNLIGTEWDQETGFGLYIGDEGGEEQYEPVTVDLTNKTVIDETGIHNIFDYIAYHTVLAEQDLG